MKKKVVVGMSGGVDSSVAAYLLKEQGYEVIGVTLQTLEKKGDGLDDAESVAGTLGIPFHVIDICKEFEHEIINAFVGEYMHGRTPNPCCMCNAKIKWQMLLEWAESIGAYYIATGHYARIDRLPNGRYAVCNSVTARKDQTYALYGLSQEQLAHTIMPVGQYEKEDIRKIAESIGISVAGKPDSQDICFIPDNDYAAFIKKRTGSSCSGGNFVDTDGNILGEHKGIFCYTIGQRKGLNLSMGKPVFVGEIRPETNEVVVGSEDIIFSTTLEAGNINLMGARSMKPDDRFLAKIRYSHKGEMCTVTHIDFENDIIRLEFDNPVRAVTPGQAVVLYNGPHVMAGAVIVR